MSEMSDNIDTLTRQLNSTRITQVSNISIDNITNQFNSTHITPQNDDFLEEILNYNLPIFDSKLVHNVFKTPHSTSNPLKFHLLLIDGIMTDQPEFIGLSCYEQNEISIDMIHMIEGIAWNGSLDTHDDRMKSIYDVFSDYRQRLGEEHIICVFDVASKYLGETCVEYFKYRTNLTQTIRFINGHEQRFLVNQFKRYIHQTDMALQYETVHLNRGIFTLHQHGIDYMCDELCRQLCQMRESSRDKYHIYKIGNKNVPDLATPFIMAIGHAIEQMKDSSSTGFRRLFHV